MKFSFKKLLIAVGAAGLLAAGSNAQAGMQLLFVDGTGNGVTGLLGAASDNSPGGFNKIQFSGVMNGWYLNATAGTLEDNPYTLTLTGSARRVTNSAADLLCPGNGIYTCGTFKYGALDDSLVDFTSNGGVGTLDQAPKSTGNVTDKISVKLNDYAFAVPVLSPGKFVLRDDMKISSTPMNGANYNLQVQVSDAAAGTDGDIVGPKGSIVNLDSKTFTGGSSYSIIKDVAIEATKGFITVGSQLDFYLPTFSTSNADAFSFTNTITIVDVPEPESLALLGLGLVGIAAFRRRRQTA